jgi:hypothetical protein
VELRFYVEDWEHTVHIPAEELVRRLLRHFPSMMADPRKGDAHVQHGLDELIKLGAPDVILESHKALFGNVIFTSISEPRWNNATATSYLQSMRPGLGDRVSFDVTGTFDESTLRVVREDLARALEMVPCSPPRESTSDEA